MSTATIVSTMQREPELLGQTVVVIGGSGGIGLETSRRARVERAKVTLAGRNPERLQHAASGVDALSAAAFDAAGHVAIERFFRDLPIGRVVGPAEVAALTIHIMSKTALMGATYDIDGEQQFVAA